MIISTSNNPKIELKNTHPFRPYQKIIIPAHFLETKKRVQTGNLFLKYCVLANMVRKELRSLLSDPCTVNSYAIESSIYVLNIPRVR